MPLPLWFLPRWARPIEKDRRARERAERHYRWATRWARWHHQPEPPPPAIRDIPPPPPVGSAAVRAQQRKKQPAGSRPRRRPQRTGPRNATIQVTRPRRFGAHMLRAITIHIDGTASGTIRPGHTLTIPVTTGFHTIDAHIDWGTSPTLDIDLTEGQTATYEVRSAPIAFGGKPIGDHYLELEAHPTTTHPATPTTNEKSP
ncbi:hypothetical protein [Austwickia sp. TVS 96-490-7B]|uniref:hypothetical protein n=1 Tax=Austwickia sp. TVS 96-490-7B TaxID=2830843 RepID=UPI001C5759E3|nr:hypothetical protein [Austwickia sp. TVS 96-490-7B]